MSGSLRPHGLQPSRFPCPSLPSWSLLQFMCIESATPSKHPILCRPLVLLPSIFPSIRVFSNEYIWNNSVMTLTLPLLAGDFLCVCVSTDIFHERAAKDHPDFVLLQPYTGDSLTRQANIRHLLSVGRAEGSVRLHSVSCSLPRGLRRCLYHRGHHSGLRFRESLVAESWLWGRLWGFESWKQGLPAG